MSTVEKTKECAEKIKRIRGLYEEIDTIFSSFTDVENHAMLLYHNEGSTLNHCVRWGLQAAIELDEAKDLGDMG